MSARNEAPARIRFYVTTRAFGHIRSEYIEAENADEAERKAREKNGVSIEVKRA